MKTESRLPNKVEPSNGDPPLADQKFRLEFTKADADEFANLMDGVLKVYGLRAAQPVTRWIDRFNEAMNKSVVDAGKHEA